MSVQSQDVVAVINYSPKRVAIWHVDIAPLTPLSRLCGAWVADPAQIWPSVVASRLALPMGDSFGPELRNLLEGTAGVVDLAATYDAVAETIKVLGDRHRESKTATGAQRAEIGWPRLRTRLSWNALPAPPRGAVDDAFVAETITVARWVADLADVWSAVEVARTSRPHLAQGDTNNRPMPVAVIAN